MKNMKKFMAVMAVASLVATSGMTAFAYEYKGNQGTNGTLSDDAKEYGHTTFSIIEAQQDPSNVSFTVPLFVTMAAVHGETELVVPTNYSITNTSKESAANADDAFDIAVIGMDFTKLQKASYSTVASGGDNKSLVLTLGDLVMPTITEDTTDAEVTKAVDIVGQTSDFYDVFSTAVGAKKEFRLIKENETFDITIAGTLGALANITANVAAIPQFKIQYVVSGVTEDGDIIGAVYAGDDKVAAGIGSYTAAAPTAN